MVDIFLSSLGITLCGKLIMEHHHAIEQQINYFYGHFP